MTAPARATVGALSQCNIAGTAFEYKSCTLAMHQEIVSTDGLRGTHNHPSERTRPGKRICSGAVTVNPGPADLTTLLPLATGGTPASNVFPFGETLASFTTIVDRVTKVATYTGCYVDKLMLEAAEGEPISLTLAIEALLETIGNAGTFSGSFNLAAPYMMMDAVLTLAGTVYQFKHFGLTIDNHLKKDRFMNSVIRTDLPFMDRIIDCDLMLPYTTDTAALYDGGGVVESLSVVFTNGSDSLTLASSGFQIEPVSPPLSGRDEILIPLKGQLRTVAGTANLTITNVSS